MCIMICPRVNFESIVTRQSIHYLLYSVCIFVLGILVQKVCFAPLICSHAWDISCMLDYACGTLWSVCLLVRAAEYFAWLRSLLSPNSCLCDGSEKYSCILYYHQGASLMGEKFAVLSMHTFCRATLSYFSNAASIDCVCNPVLSLLYSWNISCLLILAFFFA